MARAAFYAVARGHHPGVYATWDECQKEVIGYRAASFKKFDNVLEAERFAGVKSYLAPPVQASGSRTTKGRGAASSASGSSNAAAGPSRGREKRPGAKATELVPTTEDADGFMRTAEGRLVVYTDGGCIGNGKRGAKAGLGVYYGARSGRNLSEPVPGPLQTNNRGELLAILRALETAPESKGPLEIRTDSRYCIDCMTNWLPNWRRRNFKGSNGQDVVNLDLILHIERLLIARAIGAPPLTEIALRDPTREPEIGDVRLLWVKGHRGEDGNTMADRLATAGCARPTPAQGVIYGAEEQLYLHGLRASANRVKPLKSSAPTATSSVATTSSYFKAPLFSSSSALPASSAPSDATPAKRKRVDKHESSHSEADDVFILSDAESDEIEVIEPPTVKKTRTEIETDFDELDASWLLAVGLDKYQPKQ